MFPRASARKPALLVQLESLLAEKLRLTEKLAEVSSRRGGRHGGAAPAGEDGSGFGEYGGAGGYDPNGTLTLEAGASTCPHSRSA